jgi:hypothetical protein
MKTRDISSAAPNDHQAPAAHIADRSFVERATTVLLLGILWSGLAACILGALSYDIARWFEGSWVGWLGVSLQSSDNSPAIL